MLHVSALSFDYLDKSLLNNVQFSLLPGDLLHLRGDNGAGKTTLLRLLAGLIEPITGDIYWRGKSIYPNLMAYQGMLCYVGHRAGISAQLTVKENCFFDVHCQQQPDSFAQLLERFGLQGLANIACYQLSAGQRRRVALLRLALTDARIWLLDEPLVALDEPSTHYLCTCLKAHLANNGLIVLTSHQNLPVHFDNCQEYFL